MNIETRRKESFAVIGKEGSTEDGADFIARLWDEANTHFGEIKALVKTDGDGNPVGIWGAMSDFSRSFLPWENFEKGLYLAGAECSLDAKAPEGWTKWIVPAYEYRVARKESETVFPDTLRYLAENGLSLAGAVHDFIDPKTGEEFFFFPVKAL